MHFLLLTVDRCPPRLCTKVSARQITLARILLEHEIGAVWLANGRDA
jgi:hypothetical protein